MSRLIPESLLGGGGLNVYSRYVHKFMHTQTLRPNDSPVVPHIVAAEEYF